MKNGVKGTTVPRRQLGRYLRDLRNQAGMTVDASAAALEWSAPKIWRIETAQTSMRQLDVQAMCNLYGADAELTEALMALARETKSRGWWHAYGDVIPQGFDLFIGLEEAACELRWYETEVVPGLCQTESYARCVIQKDNPGVDSDEIEQRVHVRTTRGRLLRRPNGAPNARFVLGEGILYRPVGGSDIMAKQLDHLIEVAELPSTNLRIAPFTAGLHFGVMTGPFLAMRFPVRGRISEPPTIYVESFLGALYLEQEHEVARYETAFEDIWNAAADEPTSIKMIKQATMELRKP